MTSYDKNELVEADPTVRAVVATRRAVHFTNGAVGVTKWLQNGLVFNRVVFARFNNAGVQERRTEVGYNHDAESGDHHICELFRFHVLKHIQRKIARQKKAGGKRDRYMPRIT